jgi:hypothetical protein
VTRRIPNKYARIHPDPPVVDPNAPNGIVRRPEAAATNDLFRLLDSGNSRSDKGTELSYFYLHPSEAN